MTDLLLSFPLWQAFFFRFYFSYPRFLSVIIFPLDPKLDPTRSSTHSIRVSQQSCKERCLCLGSNGMDWRMIYGSCKMSDLEQKFGCESSSLFSPLPRVTIRQPRKGEGKNGWKQGHSQDISMKALLSRIATGFPNKAKKKVSKLVF